MSAYIALFGLALYLVFYFTYGKSLQRNLVRSQNAPPAPSQRLYDGVDYVPTHKFVIFGHHFASIAGAAPIVGPAMATAWGWGPSLAYIFFGNIFIGAIHDYLSLVASVRYDGRSVQFVAQDLMGVRTGKVFGWFFLFLCVLVVAAFGDVVMSQFVTGKGEVATTFFLFCASAMIMGFLMYRTKMGIGLSTLIGLGLLFLSFWLGMKYGLKASRDVWALVLFVYIIIAAALPVNILLQPRDYLNSFLLYFGLVVGGVAAIFAFKSFDSIPVFTSFSAPIIAGQPTPFWPAVPLVIGCGALSGFHALVASGTTSKQLKDEKDALFVGYGSMLTEGFLSTIVVISIAACGAAALGADKVLTTGALPRFVASYSAMVSRTLPIFSKELMALFAAVWAASFALTTLDTTNRIGRYLVHEMALPLKDKSPILYAFFSNRWAAALVIATLGSGLAWSGGYAVLWPSFAGSNQLIASVVMLTASVWVKRKMNEKYTNIVLIPAIILWITVTSGIVWYEIAVIPTFFRDMTNIMNPATGVVLGIINLVLLCLNLMLVSQFFKSFGKKALSETA